jgi:SAM-dependent methyltransferase
VGYQTFNDRRGASDTKAKLKAIGMPNDLRGTRVLDIGCAEGFFCMEAQRRGATDIVGIEREADRVEYARRNAPGIDFRNQSWDELPEGKFDLILMLAALHYERRPRAFLEQVHDRLTDDGLFILEIGVAPESGITTGWSYRKRSIAYYPTHDMLLDRYLESFSARIVGRSVDQAGDPAKRYVVHARRRQPVVILVTGPSGAGKSSLVRDLRTQTSVVIAADMLIRAMGETPGDDPPLLRQVSASWADGLHPGEIIRRVEAAGLSTELADAVYDQVPLDERLVIVEGYALTPSVVARLRARLGPDAMVWRLHREIDTEELHRLLDDRDRSMHLANARVKVARREIADLSAQLAASDPHSEQRPATDLREQLESTRLQLAATEREAKRLRRRLQTLEASRSVRYALRLARLAKPFAARRQSS